MPIVASTRLYAGELENITTTAVPLVATATPCSEVLVQNDPDSAAVLWVGTDTLQPIRVVAGTSITVPAADARLIYVRSSSGTIARIGWLGRN